MTFALLAWGVIKKDKSRLKKAGLVFLSTWIVLIVISVIEFFILMN